MFEHFPNAAKYEFKERFVERYSQFTDFEEFKACSLSFLRRSMRVNTLKLSVKECVERLEPLWNLTPIPWCKEGFWISGERRDVGNLSEHALGYIYIQESASMIPPLALDPSQGSAVLDMCAAPGSKTTQLAAMMNNTGVLVANDVDSTRIKALGLNVQRCGVRNTIITLDRHLQIGEQFDSILLDAPCSATGTIRKSPKVIRMWNPESVKRIAHQQKQLLARAYAMLKPGGTLVYSTCTLEPEENEGVIDYALSTFSDLRVQDIDLQLKRSSAITDFDGVSYDAQVKKTLRIWPQDNDTEGFFIAKLKREI